ncbi:hypothetical protein NEOLEDRAFT_282366 [Neolentinus lepideus HHB14362 ss-1]|uniref:Uncharacterized protein n=1 Tax=Neolentinus lepideus HHB14362 ss-1 TaxID=1314782 RepID=A0A165SYW5_9AGAM|nr:hypothetical protein NEOLEDRAFT_282366 [Neolentinus lepideus HHB14362 ss-1]
MPKHRCPSTYLAPTTLNAGKLTDDQGQIAVFRKDRREYVEWPSTCLKSIMSSTHRDVRGYSIRDGDDTITTKNPTDAELQDMIAEVNTTGRALSTSRSS